MPGCPKHQKGLVLTCPQCKKINNLLTKVAKDTINGKKIQYFHPFKKEDIELKIQQLAEEAKAQEVSPFCVRHFPNGGVRCHACLARQMTEEQHLHCDIQASLFGTPMPIRPEERQAAEALITEMRRSRATQAVSQLDVMSSLLKSGYSQSSASEFVTGLFATHDTDNTGVVFLHDMTIYSQTNPPRLISHLLLDSITLNQFCHEFKCVDVDGSDGISRQELADMLFSHGMDIDTAMATSEAWFKNLGLHDPNEEATVAIVYTNYMTNLRKRALGILKKTCIHLFTLCDTDKDGFLSLEEVTANCSILFGSRIHKSAVANTFQKINVSKTGKVTINELFNYYYINASLHEGQNANVPAHQRYEISSNPVSGPAYFPSNVQT